MFYMDHWNILVNLKVAPYIMLLAFDVILDNFGKDLFSNPNQMYIKFVIYSFIVVTTVADCATQAEIDSHLELGREFLAKGQLADALTQYHAAVGSYYKC